MSIYGVGDKKKPFKSYHGEISDFMPPRWVNEIAYRSFELGDLVTLSPEFRYSVAISRPDFGRYIGIVVQAYSNREYVVHWTNQPDWASAAKKAMFSGDHLILVEQAEKSMMKK